MVVEAAADVVAGSGSAVVDWSLGVVADALVTSSAGVVDDGAASSDDDVSASDVDAVSCVAEGESGGAHVVATPIGAVLAVDARVRVSVVATSVGPV